MTKSLSRAMPFSPRIRSAANAALLHLLVSIILGSLVAVFVFFVWYPHPYGMLSGGLKLFAILISVDVICGPVLTLILFNPLKSRAEIFVDMSLVVAIQLSALTYGIHIVQQARPLFLVHEVDRFRVINLNDYEGQNFAQLPSNVPAPHWRTGPVTVGIRPPLNSDERQKVMLDSIFGGRDYAQRPEFYVPYDLDYKTKALARAKPLNKFLDLHPKLSETASSILKNTKTDVDDALFLPVIHKQEWVAILDQSAHILGFLPGDGFEVQ